MYKYLLLIPALLFSLVRCKEPKASPKKVIGIGLLTVNTSYDIPLYKGDTDHKASDILKFEVEKSGVTKFVSRIKLKPYLMNAGDSDEAGRKNISMGLIRFPAELKFRVVDTTAKFFEVVTNEDTWETFFIKRDGSSSYYTTERELWDNNCSNCPGSKYNPRWFIFETWERYLKRVEFITKDKLVIYDQPGGKAVFEQKEHDFLPFGAAAVKGEWIKLKKGFGRESNFDDKINYEGWTKWREGEHMVIEVVEHTYE